MTLQKRRLPCIRQDAQLHKPDAHSQQPDATLHEPETHLQRPEANLHKPDAYSHGLDAFLHGPEAHSHRPDAFCHQPEAFLQRPEAYSHQPETYSHVHPPLTRVCDCGQTGRVQTRTSGGRLLGQQRQALVGAEHTYFSTHPSGDARPV
jgi:hypothetical protein